MKGRSFLREKKAISMMYDAVLFLVTVSLCGVALMPALYNDTLVDAVIDDRREDIADAALHSLLTSRAEVVEYRVAGDFIDPYATGIGLDISNGSAYDIFVAQILDREIRHKTYGSLIAQGLGAQLYIPGINGSEIRLNILTQDFDKALDESVSMFFEEHLDDRFGYGITAYWEPLKGIPMGGKLICGEKIPNGIDIYTARNCIPMPYNTPTFSIGNVNLTLNERGITEFMEYLLNDTSVKMIGNISDILDEIVPTDTDNESAIYHQYVSQNVSSIIMGVLVNDITDAQGNIIFKGVARRVIENQMLKMVRFLDPTSMDPNEIASTESYVNEGMNESFSFLDKTFADISGSDDLDIEGILSSLFEDAIKEILKDVIDGTIASTIDGLGEVFKTLIDGLMKIISDILSPLMVDIIDDCVEMMFDGVSDNDISTASAMYRSLMESGKDIGKHLAFSEAVVVLAIWER